MLNPAKMRFYTLPKEQYEVQSQRSQIEITSPCDGPGLMNDLRIDGKTLWRNGSRHHRTQLAEKRK